MITMKNQTRKMAAFAATIIALALLSPMASAASRGQTALAVLPISPTSWVPVAFTFVLLVIAAAGLIYILSGFIRSFQAKAWATAQIYQASLSIVLLLIFAFFSYLFFLNPQAAFGGANLVPSAADPVSCTSANTIYTLATCDISYFSDNAFNFAQSIYLVSFISGYSPGISFNASITGYSSIGASASLSDFVPGSTTQLLSTAFVGIFFALLLNQVQVILVAGSLLFLSLFLTLGLVARCFGVTRTFGGAMIALGVGLGLIYPLLIAITYGFINVSTGPVSTAAVFSNFIQLFLSAIPIVLSGQVGGSYFAVLNPHFLQQLAYIGCGLTFIPFINFMILDAFIVDFSRVMGERIDFLSLLQGLV